MVTHRKLVIRIVETHVLGDCSSDSSNIRLWILVVRHLPILFREKRGHVKTVEIAPSIDNVHRGQYMFFV